MAGAGLCQAQVNESVQLVSIGKFQKYELLLAMELLERLKYKKVLQVRLTLKRVIHISQWNYLNDVAQLNPSQFK